MSVTADFGAGALALSRLRLQVPAFGLWWADVEPQEPVVAADVPTAGVIATLTIGTAVFVGAVVSSGRAPDGKIGFRIVAGSGGWRRSVASVGYSASTAVRIATPLADVAAEVGESLDPATVPEGDIGPHWTRPNAPAAWTLHALAPRSWHVTPAGVTRFGAWPVTDYAGDAPRTRVDPALGVTTLAIEDAAGLLPGVVVDGASPATDVEIELSGSRLSAHVYAVHAAPSRRHAALEGIIKALDPQRAFRGLSEYRVVLQDADGGALALQPVRSSAGLPDLRRVPYRLGARVSLTLGSTVLVAFADSDPGRPCVVTPDATDAPGWVPISWSLGTVPRGLARLADTVQAGPFAGVVTSASARFGAGD